jgi:hypothetical protein
MVYRDKTPITPIISHIIAKYFLTIQQPNHEIEIHDAALSSHSWDLRKTIIEPMGAIQILHKTPKYEHSTYSKNSISGFGLNFEVFLLTTF